MCRMVGVAFRASFPFPALDELRRVAEVGKVPDQGDEEDGHRDGWGMVSFRSSSPFYLGRSARPIHLDPSFDQASKDIAHLDSPNILICHARRGTEGAMNLQNTHPFVADDIVFAHNGSVKDYHPRTSYSPRGDSDSARLFARFVDEYSASRDVPGSLARLLETSVRGHDYTGLILLVSDGRSLYGYRDYGPGRDGDYYDLRFVRRASEVVMYQQAEAGHPEGSEQVRKGELVTVGLDLSVRRERLP